jgi:hypothetical protein
MWAHFAFTLVIVSGRDSGWEGSKTIYGAGPKI